MKIALVYWHSRGIEGVSESQGWISSLPSNAFHIVEKDFRGRLLLHTLCGIPLDEDKTKVLNPKRYNEEDPELGALTCNRCYCKLLEKARDE